MKQFLHKRFAVPKPKGIDSLSGKKETGPYSSLQFFLLVFMLLISSSAIGSTVKEKLIAEKRNSESFLSSTFSESCSVQINLKAAAKTCGNLSNGIIELSGSSGTAPYTYSLNNGSSFQSSPLFEALAAGTYTARVQDANGCVSEPLQINLTAVSLPSVTLSLPYTAFCVSAGAIDLAGGFPAGGVYNGPGMLRGKFYPSRAGIGTHVLTYSYANENGCIGTASQTITIHPYAKVSAGADKAVYAGHKSASCTSLTATMDHYNTTYTYKWSTGATTQTIEVCPQQTTTYIVTATDPSGCSSTDEVTVTVDDARCGNNLDKVTVCHNGNTLCIAPEAVEAHLARGAVLGSCNTEKATNSKEAKVEVYPTPVKDKAQVKLLLPEQDVVSVEIVNTNGKLVKKLFEGNIAANEELVLDIDNTLGNERLYYGRLITTKGVQLFKIVLAQ